MSAQIYVKVTKGIKLRLAIKDPRHSKWVMDVDILSTMIAGNKPEQGWHWERDSSSWKQKNNTRS